MNKLKAIVNDSTQPADLRSVARFILDYGQKLDFEAVREFFADHEAHGWPVEADDLFYQVAIGVFQEMNRRYRKLRQKHKP